MSQLPGSAAQPAESRGDPKALAQKGETCVDVSERLARESWTLVSFVSVPLKLFPQRFPSGFHSVNPTVLDILCVYLEPLQSHDQDLRLWCFFSPTCFLREAILRNIRKGEFEMNRGDLLARDFSRLMYINCSLALSSAVCSLLEGM